MEAPALIRPMTGFDLYLINRMYGWVPKTLLFVTDPVYRGKQLLAVERGLMAMGVRHGDRFRPSEMTRALMPERHEVAIEGRRDPDGKMMFLLSDPERPSQVYARLMAERERDESPSG
jgi:hypothetical protein